jgi:hypothetical protein
MDIRNYAALIRGLLALLALITCFGDESRASYPPMAGQRHGVRTDLSELTVLRITSIPDSAAVVINDTIVGTTPCTRMVTPGSTVDVRLLRFGYHQWSAGVACVPGDTTELHIVLERTVAAFSVMVDGRRSAVSLDGVEISRGPVLDHPTTRGPHMITVRDDSLGRGLSEKVSFEEAKRHFFIARFGSVRPFRVLGTLLLPGSVQMSDGHSIEGAVLFVGSTALGYLTVQSHFEHTDRLHDYESAMRAYVAAATDVEAKRQHEVLSMRKNDLDRAFARRSTFVALFSLCYLYNVIDGLLNHLLGDVLEIVPVHQIPGIPFPGDLQGASMRLKF